MGEQWKQWQTLFWGLHNHCRCWLQPWNWKTLAPWKKSYDHPRQHIIKQRHYFANKGLYSQSCGFSSSHVWMWELDYKKCWVPKSWCFWTVVLEKTLESLLDCKEIQLVHPKGNKCWIFIGRTDAEADVKKWLIGKDSDAGKEWMQEEKGMTADEIIGLASLTRWTWVWVSPRSCWCTRKPGMLQSMGSQRVGHDWAIELYWTDSEITKQWLLGVRLA